MKQRPAPTLPKWPFLTGDILLLGLAWWIVTRSPDPFAFWPLCFMVLCVAGGAWIAVVPYLAEFRAAMKLTEADSLTDVVRQINELEAVAGQVAGATGQWQEVHEKAGQTIQAAREISERMTAEAKAFTEFMQKANDSEKAHLRLEVEKLRRSEAEWLQVVVLMLDHVYALYVAAVRSRRSGIIQQITSFQQACRDCVRRIGLLPMEVPAGEPYDEKTQALEEDQAPPAPETERRVAETLATGYSYQGQVVRKPMVRLAPLSQSDPASAELGPLEPEKSAHAPSGADAETPVEPAAPASQGSFEQEEPENPQPPFEPSR